jgi:adenosylmethionine-8-amino-7-oxononanoate aminotransferase
MTTSDELRARDARVLWHPATHFADLERLPPIPVHRAEGCWLYDTDDRPILDAISSWWTSIHGHAFPPVVDAIAEQAKRLDHVMFAGFTHEPAIELAEALLERAPPGYGKLFYSDCGSASIEVAIKLSFQARVLDGEPHRRRFAALRNSYHGETLGALAVCGSDTYREPFSSLLMDVEYLPAPALARHEHAQLAQDAGADAPETERACAILEAHADEITALVIEPIVQCAGKMAITGSGFYRRICETAQRLGIHVIADEIAVGFGRTGRLFASEWAGVTPDLMCVSKGLSGGVLPLAATLIRAGFEDTFAGSPSRSFMHSHTYTGNPIACAAGLASLRALDGVFTEMDGRIQAIAQRRHAVAERCEAVGDHRQTGMIAAIDVVPDKRHPSPTDGRLGLALREAALRRGVLLRPLHDTIYWMPPLTITDSELDRLAEVTIEVIEEVLS